MEKLAFIFPGQASQFVGMGKDMYEENPQGRSLFETANDIMGFRISDVMFAGSEEELKETHITQPSVFIHSIVKLTTQSQGLIPNAVAGHSLGEISALVAAKVITFIEGLKLVQIRANAMQIACTLQPGTMAAIVGLEDHVIESICESITRQIVIPANYNCPGQLVISGSLEGIRLAEEKMMAAGAKRFIRLAVGGAFHSPLMEPARETLAMAIESTTFMPPICPVYQNVNALPTMDPSILKNNLIAQLTAPVKWTQTIQNMMADGVERFYEVGGNGTVLSGFMKRISRMAYIESL